MLTGPDQGIRELAAGLADLERWYVLAERLGEPDERVRVLTTAAARTTVPREPNVVLVLDRHPADDDAPWPGGVAGPTRHPSPLVIGEQP